MAHRAASVARARGLYTGWCRARVLVVAMGATDGPIYMSGLVLALPLVWRRRPLRAVGARSQSAWSTTGSLCAVASLPCPPLRVCWWLLPRASLAACPRGSSFFVSELLGIVSPSWMSSGWLVAGALHLAKRSARGSLAVSLSRNQLRLHGADVLSSNTPMATVNSSAPLYVISGLFVHCYTLYTLPGGHASGQRRLWFSPPTSATTPE